MKSLLTLLFFSLIFTFSGTAFSLDAPTVYVFDEASYGGPIGGFYSGSYGGVYGPAVYITGDLSSYDYTGVKLLWLVPADNFTQDELDTMAAFLGSGGRIGFLGAWYDFAPTRDNAINSAISALGGHISINTTYTDNGYPHYAYRSDGKIMNDLFTQNVNSFVYGLFSPLALSGSAKALVLGEDSSSALLACENIGPGAIFVMSSQSAWDLDPFSAGTDNRTLFANILTSSNPIPGIMTIQSFAVKAGKSRGLDSISFSGKLDAQAATLSSASEIQLSISSSEMTSPVTAIYPITPEIFKKSKFSGKTKDTSFTLDTKTGKMSFSAKNQNLTGLACPITVTVTIADYEAQTLLDETVVNGTKCCPLMLVQGFANNLTADKYSFKPGKLAGQDSFTISGTFTLAGPILPGEHFRIRVGNNTFTVDDDWFIEKKPGVWSCTSAPVVGLTALVIATLDYNKCTYTISVKNATISDLGALSVNMEIFGYTVKANTLVHFNRKVKPVLEIELSTEFDYGHPGTDDDEYGFSIDIATTAAVEMLEIKFPSGATYFIPNNDYGSTAPFNGGWREVASEYDADDDCYEWWYWIVFETADDLLDNMEDGLYQFTFYLPNAERLTTTVWFGVPKTSSPIPQPTQIPAFTSFDDYEMLTSPVPFQWEPCTDPAVKTIWLELYGDYDGDYDPDYGKELNITKTTTTGIRPLSLKPGRYEAELDFDAWYEFINENGIPVEVGKYSECDYYFEVND